MNCRGCGRERLKFYRVDWAELFYDAVSGGGTPDPHLNPTLFCRNANRSEGIVYCITTCSPAGSSSSVCSGLVCCWEASSLPSIPRKGSDDWVTSCCDVDVVEVLAGAVEIVTPSRSAHKVTIASYDAGTLPMIEVSISLSCWGNTIYDRLNTLC
jgi:hypothetical protein